MNNQKSPIRAVVAGVVLLIILMFVLNWWGDYRRAAADDGASSTESTATADATGTADTPADPDTADAPDTGSTTEAATPMVVVLVDGLNLRKSPSTNAESIANLDLNAKLTYIATEGRWYKVKDQDGTVGYVSAGADYTRLEK